MNLQTSPSDKASWDWRAALAAGRLARGSGDVQRAEQRFRESLDLAEAAHSDEGVEEASNSLGVALAQQGRLEEAEALLSRVLQAAPGGSEDGSRLRTIEGNLAEVLSRQGKIAAAEALMRRLLPEVEGDPELWIVTLNNLAVALESQGSFDQAEIVLRQAVTEATKALGPAHASTIGTLSNLGVLLMNAGKIDEGRGLVQRAVNVLEATFGSDYPETIRVRAELNAR